MFALFLESFIIVRPFLLVLKFQNYRCGMIINLSLVDDSIHWQKKSQRILNHKGYFMFFPIPSQKKTFERIHIRIPSDDCLKKFSVEYLLKVFRFW